MRSLNIYSFIYKAATAAVTITIKPINNIASVGRGTPESGNVSELPTADAVGVGVFVSDEAVVGVGEDVGLVVGVGVELVPP